MKSPKLRYKIIVTTTNGHVFTHVTHETEYDVARLENAVQQAWSNKLDGYIKISSENFRISAIESLEIKAAPFLGLFK